VFETINITETLCELIDKYDWAVVITPGTKLNNASIIRQGIDYAISLSSPLSCHLLDEGGYFHFHPQYFTIDLAVYKQIGCPNFEKINNTVTIETLATSRSTENIHDNYTPIWIKPDNTALPHTYTSKIGYFGINVIAALIKNGYSIVNIPTHIRKNKSYAYPNHQFTEIKNMIDNPYYVPSKESMVYYFYQDMMLLTSGLHKGFYVLNTEPLGLQYDQVKNQPFDCFIGVSSGIKPAALIGKLNLVDNCRVLLIDISPAAIKWQQYLLEFWDGDFETFITVFENFTKLNPELIPILFRHLTFEQIFIYFFKNSQMNNDEFKQCWKKYQNMDVEFLEINLLDESATDKLINIINHHTKGAYIWVSNVFNMSYLSFYYTNKGALNRKLSFVNKIQHETKIPVIFDFAKP
jgi:hypothetical protein